MQNKVQPSDLVDQHEAPLTSKKPSELDKSQPVKSWIQVIQEIIGLLGGLAVLMVTVATAIMLVLGRIRVQTFYTTLNIPFDLISFSIWEYNEQGWPYLWQGFVAAAIMVAYVFMLSQIYSIWISFVLLGNIIVDFIGAIIASVFFFLIPKKATDIILIPVIWIGKVFASWRSWFYDKLKGWWSSRKAVYKQRYHMLDDEYDKKLQQVSRANALSLGILLGIVFLSVIGQGVRLSTENRHWRNRGACD